MYSFFLDARVLVKRYATERGTELVDHLFARASRDRLLCSMLGGAEVLAQLCRRRQSGRLTPALFSAGLLQFPIEIMESSDVSKLPPDNALIRAALPRVEQSRLGAVDGIVLRTALDAAVVRRAGGHDLVLMPTTPPLVRAAHRQGLITFNPETQIQTELDALLA